MRQGDTVRLKADYHASTRIGNVGLYFGEGTKGIILKTQEGSSVVEVGFSLNETITIGALIDIGALEKV